MARHYAYRTTAEKLNDAFERIDDDDGQVVQTIHLGGRDFIVVYAKDSRPVDVVERAEQRGGDRAEALREALRLELKAQGRIPA